MPIVWIPALLRSLMEGHDRLAVSGRTIGEVIIELDNRYPGIRSRLCDDNGLRPGIAVAVDAELARLGLLQPVQEQSEIHFLPAVSGG